VHQVVQDTCFVMISLQLKTTRLEE